MSDDGKKKRREEFSDSDDDDDDYSSRKGKVNDPYLMDAEERREWRMKIREVMKKYPDVDEDEELDSEEKRMRMEKLLADYPLIVDEDDPDWPEDADGRGFGLDQFFNKITIKNKKKDDDDENYDSDKEIVWQDDDYIRPIKDITTAGWEEAVFKDISPLIVLVHNRYKRLALVLFKLFDALLKLFCLIQVEILRLFFSFLCRYTIFMIVFCIMASFIKNKGLVFHYSMKVHHSQDWFLHRGFIY